jgi:putative salt-induced outer membrane protein YdiY
MTFRIFTTLFIVLSSLIFSDLVILNNGDQIHGKITSMTQDFLQLKTEGIGEISIKRSKVISVETKTPYPIILKNGTQFTGYLEINTKQKGSVTIKGLNSQLNTQIPFIEVLAINRKNDLWVFAAGFGYSGLRGNSNNTNINTRVNATRPFTKHGIQEHSVTFNGTINYKSNEGETSEKKGKFNFTFYSFIIPKLEWFFSETLSYNYMQFLKLRAVESIGLEYALYKTDTISFHPTIAFSRTDSIYQENTETTASKDYFGIVPGWKFKWTIWKNIRLSNEFTYSSDIYALNNSILDLDTNLSFPMIHNFYLVGSYDICYSSKPPKNTKRLDRTATFRVEYHF